MGYQVLDKRRVDYPASLSVSSENEGFGNLSSQGSKTYKLVALIEHFGHNPQDGHYIAYKKNASGEKVSEGGAPSWKWLQANDERI